MEMLLPLFLLAIFVQLLTVFVVIWAGLNRWLSGFFVLISVIASSFITPWSLLVGLPIVLMGVVLLVPRVRQPLLSNRVYRAFSASMPPVNITEGNAIEVSTNWWEKELFRGRPDWQKFADYTYPTLTDDEQHFLDNEVAVLCEMLNEWDMNRHQLSLDIWQYLSEHQFLGLSVAGEYGGLGFSPYAQSCIFSKISSRSQTVAMICMLPSSLGVSELLMRYGTKQQKERWLPKLVTGEEVPCLGLSGVDASSEIDSDRGVVCYDFYQGSQVLGIRLNFSKRWVALAPIATVMGLAFKLYDPDRLLFDSSQRDFAEADLFDEDIVDYGVTCALIPTNHEGIQASERYQPMGSAIINGRISGEDVFIPLSFIIGGAKNIGKGWGMLVECLSIGRGVSLPALASTHADMSYLNTSAFVKVREQLKTSMGKLESVQSATSNIASHAYMLEAIRHFVASGLSEGGAPNLMTTIAKYQTTEAMRESINDSMDVLGGQAIQQGPRNLLAPAYQSIPVAMTVAGSNLLTPSSMIFAQGVMQCHPYLYDELKLLQQYQQSPLVASQIFDKLFIRHLCYALNRGTKAFASALFGGRAVSSKLSDRFSKPYYKHINRLSASFSFTTDCMVALFGGDLKRKDMIASRLADIHAHLFIMSATLQFYHHGNQSSTEQVHARLVLQKSLYFIQESFFDLFENLPTSSIRYRLARWSIKKTVFPLGRCYKKPSDKLKQELAYKFMLDGDDNPFRELLKGFVHHNNRKHVSNKLENAYQTLLAIEPLWTKFKKAEQTGMFAGLTFEDHVINAIKMDFVSVDEAEALLSYNGIRYDAMLTDIFDTELQPITVRNNPHSLQNAMNNVTEYVDDIHLTPAKPPVETLIYQNKLEKQQVQDKKSQKLLKQLSSDHEQSHLETQSMKISDKALDERDSNSKAVVFKKIWQDKKKYLNASQAHQSLKKQLGIQKAAGQKLLQQHNAKKHQQSIRTNVTVDTNIKPITKNAQTPVVDVTDTTDNTHTLPIEHKIPQHTEQVAQSLVTASTTQERLDASTSDLSILPAPMSEPIREPISEPISEPMLPERMVESIPDESAELVSGLPENTIHENMISEQMISDTADTSFTSFDTSLPENQLIDDAQDTVDFVEEQSMNDSSNTENTPRQRIASAIKQSASIKKPSRLRGSIAIKSNAKTTDRQAVSHVQNQSMDEPVYTHEDDEAEHYPNYYRQLEATGKIEEDSLSTDNDSSQDNATEVFDESDEYADFAYDIEAVEAESVDSAELVEIVEATAPEPSMRPNKRAIDRMALAGKIGRNPENSAFELLVQEEVSKNKAIEALKAEPNKKQASRELDPVDIMNMRRKQRRQNNGQ